jgi:hypothetical protein
LENEIVIYIYAGEVRYFFYNTLPPFFLYNTKILFFPLSRRVNEDGGRDVKRTSLILSWWNMDCVEAF